MRLSLIARISVFTALVFQATALSGCSFKRYAINTIGDSLSEGVSVYETDPDIDLIGEALPFSLKLLETLLAESPKHKGLLLSACKGFTLYSYVYVQQEAEMEAGNDLARQRAMNLRARGLLLRALDYGVRGLDVAHPGFRDAFAKSTRGALKTMKRGDVPMLYWCATALGLAISSSRGDAEMIARLPEVDAMLARAIELDPDWQEGTLHEFKLILAGARPSMSAEDTAGIGKSYERALSLSGGRRASLFVSYAEAVCVKAQDRVAFRGMLDRALAIDPDREETLRLANHVSQRRARWLLGRIDDLFLEPEEPAPKAAPTTDTAPPAVPVP